MPPKEEEADVEEGPDEDPPKPDMGWPADEAVVVPAWWRKPGVLPLP